MTTRELHSRAEQEWSRSSELRRRYPTFVHYWRERYERVYGLERHWSPA